MTPRCCWHWLLALILAVLAAGASHAQEDAKVPVIPFDGTEVFTYLLQARKLQPIRSIAELADVDPKQTLIVVFGRTDDIAKFPWTHRPAEFMRRGGSLLVASDFPDAERLATLGVGIMDASVYQDMGYQDIRDCPLLTEFTQANPLLMQGLSKGLATNRPSYLSLYARSRLQPLVNFPKDCRHFQRGAVGLFKTFPMGTGYEHYAVATPLDLEAPGRAVVLAGHGLFTNGMMLQSDNDNFEFGVNCLRWLGDHPDGGKREYALFIVDGEVVQSFDVSLKPPLPPIPVPTIQLVNQLLHGLERENFFIRLLRDNVDVRVPVRVTLMVLTIALLVYGAKKLSEQRHHPEAGSALLVGAYAAPIAPSALMRQRSQAQIERAGLWEEARALARQWLFEIGGIPLADWDQPWTAHPEFEVNGGWWQRRRLRCQADRVAQLAGQHAATNFSWRELVRLTEAMRSLSQAVHEGRLRLRGCSAAEKS